MADISATSWIPVNSFPGMAPNTGPLLNSLTGVWPHLSQYLEFDQKEKCFETLLFYAESTGTMLSAVINAHHFDRGDQSSSPFSSIIIFPLLVCFFSCYFLRHMSNLNFRKDTFSNTNSYFTFTSLNGSHSLQNGLTWKAVKSQEQHS